MTQLIPVSARTSPLRLETLHLTLPHGLSVAEIVRQVLEHPHFPPHLAPVLTVTLNEDVVPRDRWRLVRPKPGARVAVVPLYQGGEGKGGTILSALVLVASAVATVAFGPIGGALVGLAGTAALAVFAPKPPRLVEGAGSTSQLSAAGFAGNELSPYGQIPTVAGRIRVAPYILTPPWMRFTSTDQLLRGVVGLSGHIEWSDILANGAVIADAEQVLIETVNGDGDSLVAFPSFVEAQDRTEESGITDIVGLELRKHALDFDGHTANYSPLEDQATPANSVPKFYSFVTKDSPDIICINLQFPVGLYESDGPAAVRTTLFRMRMRLLGETAWRNLPEVAIVGPRVGAFNYTFYISWEDNFDPGESSGAIAYESNAGTGGGPAAWTADIYFDRGSHLADHCLRESQMRDEQFSPTEDFSNTIGMFLNETSGVLGANTPWPKGRYEFQIKRSAVIEGTTMAWAADGDGNTCDPFGFVTEVSSDRVAPSQGDIVDTCILHSVTYLWDEQALQAPNTAALAFELRNTQVDHLTAIAESWATTLTPLGEWTGYQPTRNPAALFRHVLRNDVLNKRPLDLSLIDDARLAEWYQYCQTNELYCDIVIEDGSVDDALLLIARAGHAVIARSGRSWRVAIDKNRTGESPTVVFSPRNTREFVVERSFEEMAHGIRATFLDEDNAYTTTEIFVYDDGQSEATATIIRAVDYKGITNQARVERLALLDLRKARLRRNTYSFETGAMSLAIDKGDLVGLATDVLDGFWGWAYVTKVYRNSTPAITALDLDMDLATPPVIDDVYTVPGVPAIATPYAAITYRDGSQVVEHAIDAIGGRTRQIRFVTPITETALIAEQCHVSIAPQSATYRRCLVEDIRPGRDFTAQVVLRDEAPAIFAV